MRRVPGHILARGGLVVATGVMVAAGMFSVLRPSSDARLIDMGIPWVRHTIVAGASGAAPQPNGADGVDIADINGDARPDVVSGHEGGLGVTVSLNPGPTAVHDPWPTVMLAKPGGEANLCSPEDAVFSDVDSDGSLDVVVACELGAAARVVVFFSPAPPNTDSEYMSAAGWTRVDVTASAGKRALRVQVGNIVGDSAKELVVGEKESSGPCVAAAVGYYSSATPRTAASWAFTPITPVGWIKDMRVLDLDGDVDLDIVYSDGDVVDCPTLDNTKVGVRFLRNNGDGTFATPILVSPVQLGFEWFDLFDWDGNGHIDVAACRSNATLNESWIFYNQGSGTTWTSRLVAQPGNVGECQDATTADVDGDGDIDLSFTYNHAEAPKSSTVWYRRAGPGATPSFARGEISGAIGSGTDVKLDNGRWADLDGDGDLEIVVSEQHQTAGTGPGLGVLFYSNPVVAFVPPPPPTGVSCTLLASNSSSTDGTSVTTAATITPTANALVLAAITSCNASGPNTPTAAGLGLTWDLVATVSSSTGNGRKVTLRRGMGASPTAGTVAFDFAGQTQTCFAWSIVECTDVDQGGTNGSEAVAQAVTATSGASDVTTIHAALAAMAADSRSLAFVGLDTNSSITPDLQWTELSDIGVATGNATLEVETSPDEIEVDPTFSTASAGIVIVEVAPE